LAIDCESLMARPFKDIVHHYEWRDTVLSALGVGADPLSKAKLRYVFEKDLQALPTMAVVLGHPFFPGEKIRTEMWQEGDVTLFRCTAIERQTIVLDRGEARFAGTFQPAERHAA
jgi:hypothetical protein